MMTIKKGIFSILLFTLCLAKVRTQHHDLAKHAGTSIYSDNLSPKMLEQMVNFDYQTTFDYTGWNDFKWVAFQFDNSYYVDSVTIHIAEDIDFNKTEFSLELKFGQTTQTKVVNSRKITFMVRESIRELILLKIQNKRWNFEKLTEIEIFTNKIITTKGRPKIKLSNDKIIHFNNLLKGLTQAQIEKQDRNWKVLNRLYKKYLKPHYSKKENENFKKAISKRNESLYCYKMLNFINRNNIKELKLLNQLAKHSQCNVEEVYFEQNIPFPTELYKEKYYYQKEIVYGNKEDIEFLEEIVKKGNAWAGHASIHLALMKSLDSYPLIYNLRNDQNVYAQLIALKTSKYFGENNNAKEIAISMYENELKCLRNDNLSCHGKYAAFAAESILDLYPNLALEMLNKLHETYLKTYPRNYFLPKFTNDNNHIELIEENQLSNSDMEIINSIQSAEKYIESLVSRKLKKFPHWEKNQNIISIFSNSKYTAAYNTR